MTHPPMQLALGTVQFGLPYGAVGSGAAVDEAQAASILDDAWQGGVRWLDTATAYGDIEHRLARLCGPHPFDIVSKIPPLSALPAVARPDAVRRAIGLSLERLNGRLGAVLFHHGSDLMAEGGDACWAAARDALRDLPRSIRLGVSLYGPDDLLDLADRFDLDMAQLPANALDQRLARTLADPALARRLAPIALHVRSAFLQGLLLQPELGARRVPLAREALSRWTAHCAHAGQSPMDAALASIQALPGVEACVVGVESLAQWRDIATRWTRVTPRACPEMACADPEVIDPRRWPAG